MTWGARDVTVRFGQRVALDAVSIDVAAGEVTAVVGGDGAGKTTLLRALVGALAVDAGTVGRPDATRLGYLAATSGTYPDLTVAENIEFAATAYGVASAARGEWAAELLERAGLAAARDRLAGRLSGGMRQKLGVIRALLHRPELLVLDEPTTGVDPVSRVDLWWLIARAAADGAAVVFATTYLDEAERAASLLHLDEGRALAAGTPEEVIAAMPGTLWRRPDRPDDEDGRRRAWRRGSRWQVWAPDGQDVAGGVRIEPDLQDAVTVLELVRQPAGSRS